MPQTGNKPLRITKEIIARKEADRETMRKKMTEPVPGTAVLNIIKSPRKYQALLAK